MLLKNNYARWLKRGRQRAAVAQVLRKPMTATEICSAAQELNPRIQLRDVWFLMQQMQQRGLVICLNPSQKTGRLYCLTDKGRQVVRRAFERPIPDPPAMVNWRKYALIVRAEIRRLALFSLGQMEFRTQSAQTATSIRKCICVQRGVGLNPVLRALKDLARLGFVQEVGVTPKRHSTLYRMSLPGRRALEQLRR